MIAAVQEAEPDSILEDHWTVAEVQEAETDSILEDHWMVPEMLETQPDSILWMVAVVWMVAMVVCLAVDSSLEVGGSLLARSPLAAPILPGSVSSVVGFLVWVPALSNVASGCSSTLKLGQPHILRSQEASEVCKHSTQVRRHAGKGQRDLSEAAWPLILHISVPKCFVASPG
jgi:hypothetical protein